MARYLVVAHQTATSRELLDCASDIAADDPQAVFTLLIPATHVNHLLAWEQGESEQIAGERGEAARERFRAAGLEVAAVKVGDWKPLLAIEDELRTRPGGYDAVVLSTLRPGVSRWLELDPHRRTERTLDIPVVHVVEGERDAWRRAGGMAALRRSAPAPRAPLPARAGVRMLSVAVLMLVYVGLVTVLAVRVDRAFFVNDALAITIFGGFIVGLVLIGRDEAASTRTAAHGVAARDARDR